MNKTPIVLLLCLSMGCSTARSAAGGFSLASGITTGIATATLVGLRIDAGDAVHRGYYHSGIDGWFSAEAPYLGAILGSALLSATFSTLAHYLLHPEVTSTTMYQRDQIDPPMPPSTPIRQPAPPTTASPPVTGLSVLTSEIPVPVW